MPGRLVHNLSHVFINIYLFVFLSYKNKMKSARKPFEIECLPFAGNGSTVVRIYHSDWFSAMGTSTGCYVNKGLWFSVMFSSCFQRTNDLFSALFWWQCFVLNRLTETPPGKDVIFVSRKSLPVQYSFRIKQIFRLI